GVITPAVETQLGQYGTVERLAGLGRYETSVAISAASFPDGADVVYIASGTNYPDALSGAPVAGMNSAPILLTPAEALPAAVKNELDRLNPTRIVVLGGVGVITPAVETQLGQYTQ
ncbi:Putative cell wall binding repeat 2, partial [Microbacterium sp. cf046]|uniref:cell wall-binding repeat-containing protein n=1 Tax=Microbacterium sp. cf046 TaxID=1761803 RepID=UPI0008EDECD2